MAPSEAPVDLLLSEDVDAVSAPDADLRRELDVRGTPRMLPRASCSLVFVDIETTQAVAVRGA